MIFPKSDANQVSITSITLDYSRAFICYPSNFIISPLSVKMYLLSPSIK